LINIAIDAPGNNMPLINLKKLPDSLLVKAWDMPSIGSIAARNIDVTTSCRKK